MRRSVKEGVASRALVSVGLLAGGLLVAGSSELVAAAPRDRAAPHTTAARGPVPRPFVIPMLGDRSAAPPTTAQCELLFGIACYSPKQIQTAYDMAPLYKKGDNGKGETIVIVDAYGSPSIASDLAAFDKGFGLAAPPSLTIITPVGKPPAYNPSSAAMQSWAIETSLDVEYAHAMAPGANLLLVETPQNETIGTAGFGKIVQAEEYVIKNKLGEVISQSFGAPEQTFPSAASITALRGAYTLAATDGVTVLAASGDAGASGPENAAGTEFFTKPVINWPASDPLVTSVGGTQLHLSSTGARKAPDNVWNDTALSGSPAAGGGGLSTVFGRPSYQSGVASIVGAHRGVPDVALSAAIDGSVLIYLGLPGLPGGFFPVGGTSEASPLFAGVVAIADQVAGKSLGDLNPALYTLGTGGLGIVDVTAGNNTVTFSQGGKSVTVQGSKAVKGFDLASGLGTIDGNKLVTALAG